MENRRKQDTNLYNPNRRSALDIWTLGEGATRDSKWAAVGHMRDNVYFMVPFIGMSMHRLQYSPGSNDSGKYIQEPLVSLTFPSAPLVMLRLFSLRYSKRTYTVGS